MSLSPTFTIRHQVHIQAGPYSQNFTWEARPSHIREQSCLLLLYWDKENAWLKPGIKAIIDQETEKTHGSQLTSLDRQGSNKLEDWQKLREVHQAQREMTDTLQRNSFLVLQWYPRFKLELEILLDTNRKSFKTWVDKKNASGSNAGQDHLVFPIHVMAFSPSAPQGETGSVGIVLKPCTALHPFDGGVGLDLGNTSSSLVALRFGSWKMSDVLELNGNEGVDRAKRLMEQNQPVESLLRLDEVETPLLSPKPGEAVPPIGVSTSARSFGQEPFTRHDEVNPDACSYVIGKTARQGISPKTPLVFGAKRILQTKEKSSFSIRLKNKDWRIGRSEVSATDFKTHHPAELLIARLLEKFSGAILNSGNLAGFPEHIAVTYPATYDRHEIDKLRKTVTRAWLRFRGMDQTILPGKVADKFQKTLLKNRDLEDSQDDIHPLIPLMIDEATAAAFYFLHGEVFESPGGLASFSYLYPKGMTILLYDCGGGTTDIALVNACVSPSQEDRLLMKVLGRTGDGNFGGDNITEAVCKLLKAKIGAVILKSREEERNVPFLELDKLPAAGNPGALVKNFIDDISRRDPGDQLVPTQFKHEAAEPDYDAKARMIELWQWGEEIKITLSGKKKAPEDLNPKDPITYNSRSNEIASVKIAKFSFFQNVSSALAKSILSSFNGLAPEEVRKKLDNIEISRAEVDALIGPAVLATISKANNLLRAKMEPVNQYDLNTVNELNWVVLSGNGGQYPLVGEMVTRELHGVDIEDKKKTIPMDDLKDAVAKGAVLFLNCLKVRGKARVDFDTKLSDCLPFDIGCVNNKTNQIQVIFEEGSRYTKLVEKTIPVYQGEGDASQTLQFAILRRYPGEENPNDPRKGFKTYMTYTFDEKIRGDLVLKYDLEENNFTLRDSGGQDAKGKPFSKEESYLAPVETGII